ncbi:MAG TPA: hypothetical protein VMY37_27870 [Thermoguttaceae bacterium]|nr:hypothetical protein [Thermoguttaceae bacterium]
MQIAPLAQALKEVTASEPALADLLAGGLHYGTRAGSSDNPFGLLTIEETEREHNSSGVDLVTYLVTLSIHLRTVGAKSVVEIDRLLGLFRRYWSRLAALPTLDSDLAEFVSIHPVPSSAIGENAEEDLGQDILLGVTSWTIKLAEHQPALT